MQWDSPHTLKQYVQQLSQIIKMGKEMYFLVSYVEFLWLAKNFYVLQNRVYFLFLKSH